MKPITSFPFTFEQRMQHLSKAPKLRRSLGTRVAAGYLRNRGWPLDVALFVLLRTTPR
jgi:hypothetical protein